jgi:hypothetical protein
MTTINELLEAIGDDETALKHLKEALVKERNYGAAATVRDKERAVSNPETNAAPKAENETEWKRVADAPELMYKTFQLKFNAWEVAEAPKRMILEVDKQGLIHPKVEGLSQLEVIGMLHQALHATTEHRAKCVKRMLKKQKPSKP